MREVELRMVARADVDTVDALDPRVEERALGSTPEIESSVRRQIGVEELRDLGSDLVAARSDRGADDGSLRPVSESGDAGADDALGEPAPAGVQDREPARPVRCRDGDGEAIG